MPERDGAGPAARPGSLPTPLLLGTVLVQAVLFGALAAQGPDVSIGQGPLETFLSIATPLALLGGVTLFAVDINRTLGQTVAARNAYVLVTTLLFVGQGYYVAKRVTAR